MNDKTVLVLISGNGSNLQAMIDAGLSPFIKAVISNNKDAFGLERAKRANITTHTINDIEKDLTLLFHEYQPDLIVLAGFMKIIPTALVHATRGKMINIHPALLPKYRGLNTYQRVLEAGDKETGTSVHFVTEDLDAGPIIAQTRCPVLDNDSVDSLKTKIQALEHVLYPQVVQWFVEDKIALQSNGVFFEGTLLPAEGIQF